MLELRIRRITRIVKKSQRTSSIPPSPTTTCTHSPQPYRFTHTQPPLYPQSSTRLIFPHKCSLPFATLTIAYPNPPLQYISPYPSSNPLPFRSPTQKTHTSPPPTHPNPFPNLSQLPYSPTSPPLYPPPLLKRPPTSPTTRSNLGK